MRAPGRGSDYRRRLLIETMRGHGFSSRTIRRLRTREQGAETPPRARWEARAVESRGIQAQAAND